MNINRDYLIKVDRKSGSVDIPSAMSFCITDIKTSNIFCQLVTNESSSELVKKYSPVENAENYEILLRVIKANNEPKELQFTLVDELDAFFMVDLTEDLKDYVGKYKCELFVDCMVNGELERITTSAFTYSVRDSIMNSLDEVIEGDPDYPLVDEILSKLEGIDTDGLATEEYVNEAIANIPGGECNIEVIGGNEEILVLAPIHIMDIWDENHRTVLLKNVKIGNDIYDNDIVLIYQTPTESWGEYLHVHTVNGEHITYRSNLDDDPEFRFDPASSKDTFVSSSNLVLNNPVFTGSISLGRKEGTQVGNNTFAVGYDVTASYAASHAEGQGTVASGYASHAEGAMTTASGYITHAEGQNTVAGAYVTHAEGYNTIASSDYQHVQGKYNKTGNYAHIVGNGTSDSNRKNAHTLDWDGNAWYQGNVYVGGTSKDNSNKLATELYVDNAIANIDTECNITVIGGQEEMYIFSPDDVPDNSQGVYLFRNVEISGYSIYEGDWLMSINTYTGDDNVKWIDIVDTWGNDSYFYVDENGELVLDDEEGYVLSSELELYADKEYVDSLIGDIEDLLGGI